MGWHTKTLLLVMILAAGVSAAHAETGSSASYVVPSEILVPVTGQAIYVGDALNCTAKNEGVWRYGADRNLYMCHMERWIVVNVTPEAQ